MRADDSRLLGIPRSRDTITSPCPQHGEVSAGYPDLSAEGERPAACASVARVRPRTSKGITDLLLLHLVWLKAICPSKKFAAYLDG